MRHEEDETDLLVVLAVDSVSRKLLRLPREVERGVACDVDDDIFLPALRHHDGRRCSSAKRGEWF